MENKDVARIFSEIADILELQEGNPFRIRSFRRVAQIIENLPFSVAQAVTEEPDRLRAISGIGEGTISKLREIAETGECKEYLELRDQIPASLVTLLHLQNLGPKKIALLWKTLQISNLVELEAAAKAEKLRQVPGLGEKSEAKILQAIEEFRNRQGRYRLDDGLGVSQSMVDYLKSSVEVKRIAAAGSVRRRCETIGDIDVLVTCESPQEAIEAFCRHPDVGQVLAKGETKVSVLLRPGVQADLRVLDDNSFGAALQYFTGSKAHNVALRERAKRMGCKINEYGLFRAREEGADWEEKIAGQDEEEIYRLLGLAYIPPELRENRGEIEKAEKDQLPRLVERKDIRGDLHMHTTATDGKDSIEEMARAGEEAGYEYIAITDHSKALAMARGLDEKRLMLHIEEMDRISSSNPGITILKGIEVDILADGKLDLEDSTLAYLDVVIASIHSRFNMTRKEMTLRICRAIENPHVNILAHPTGRLVVRREPYPLDMEQVIRTAVESGVCLEINAYPARLDLSDIHCRTARDMGALISINSDSHNRSMLRYMEYGIYTARRGWLGPDDIINTYPLPRLRKVLKKEKYR
ncbi:MAG: DNA polymerase/3'-5' exonuclease PolX [Acidobacteriota bacterium]